MLNGFAKIIIRRVDEEFEKYKLIDADITNFDQTVPTRESDGKLFRPRRGWLFDFFMDKMPQELTEMMEDNGLSLNPGEFGELRAFLIVNHRSIKDLILHDAVVTPFDPSDL